MTSKSEPDAADHEEARPPSVLMFVCSALVLISNFSGWGQLFYNNTRASADEGLGTGNCQMSLCC